jgi:hypothetical protein
MSESVDLQGFCLLGERYTQRMTTQNWKQVLLNDRDRVIYAGIIRQLRAVPLGYGVVLIKMEEIKEP